MHTKLICRRHRSLRAKSSSRTRRSCKSRTTSWFTCEISIKINSRMIYQSNIYGVGLQPSPENVRGVFSVDCPFHSFILISTPVQAKPRYARSLDFCPLLTSLSLLQIVVKPRAATTGLLKCICLPFFDSHCLLQPIQADRWRQIRALLTQL